MKILRGSNWGFIVVCLLWVFSIHPSWAQSLEYQIFPSGRAVQVGDLATAFFTIDNTGTTDILGCAITPVTSVSNALFLYAPVDPVTSALSGPANTPVDIPAGMSQKFNITFVPNTQLAPIDVQFIVVCTNTALGSSTPGLNTLLLSASATPVADIVALTSAPAGLVTLPSLTATEPFLIASLNLGASDLITMSADTGNPSLPLNLLVCEFDASIGNCVAPPSPTTARTINTGEVTFYAVFVVGQGSPIPHNPATNRILVRFQDSGNSVRGLTSVAVSTGSSQPSLVGSFQGMIRGTTVGCIDFDPGEQEDFSANVTLSLSEITPSSFNGTGTILDPLFPNERTNLTISNGEISPSESLTASLTYESFDEEGFDSSGTGTLTGQKNGNTLLFTFTAQDVIGDICTATGELSLTRSPS